MVRPKALAALRLIVNSTSGLDRQVTGFYPAEFERHIRPHGGRNRCYCPRTLLSARAVHAGYAEIVARRSAKLNEASCESDQPRIASAPMTTAPTSSSRRNRRLHRSRSASAVTTWSSNCACRIVAHLKRRQPYDRLLGLISRAMLGHKARSHSGARSALPVQPRLHGHHAGKIATRSAWDNQPIFHGVVAGRKNNGKTCRVICLSHGCCAVLATITAT